MYLMNIHDKFEINSAAMDFDRVLPLEKNEKFSVFAL